MNGLSNRNLPMGSCGDQGMKISKRVVSILTCAAILYCGLSCVSEAPISDAVKLSAIGGFLLLALMIWLLELKRDGAAKKSKSDKTNFDWGMHYFRAFAILMIMATHYASRFGYSRFCDTFLSSSTIYFLFISGYLCQYIDCRRRDTPLAYYRKKLLNVICPFVLFSIVFLYARHALCGIGSIRDVLLGRAQVPYWYIPFVSLLFAISPLLCRMRNGLLLSVFGISAFMFVVFPFRPGTAFNLSWPYTFYLYSYFSVFYVLGFVYCRFKDPVDRWINSRLNLLLFVGGGIVSAILLWDPNVLGVSCFSRGLVVGAQRSCVLAVFLILLGHLRTRKIRLLDWLAQYSFTLYFIHFGLFARTGRFHDVLISYIPLPVIAADCVVFCIYLAGMLFSAMVFKNVLGRHSRMLLGT